MNGSSGLDTNDGYSWDTPKLTIQNATGTVSPNGVVTIADGVYSGYGNTNITINQNMTIKGQSQTGTIINGTNTDWIFYINGVTVTLQNLTITNGYTTDYAGAIYNDGNLTVTDSNFIMNYASEGGAIYNTGTLNVTGSTFTGNTAYYSGGAIRNDYGTCTVTDSTFNNNTATEGGAIGNFNGGSVTVINSIFTDNTGNYYGGAIENYATLNVMDSAFNGNIALFDGGAIENANTLNVTGTTFTNNHAANVGGAIDNYQGTCTANFNSFYNNTAARDGNTILNTGNWVNAENNWWGINNPDTDWTIFLSGVTSPTRWVQLAIDASPDVLCVGETSTVIANLNYNNLGENLLVTYGKSIPNTEVLFNVDNLGTLNTYNGIISNGNNATTTFTAGQMPGISKVNATVNNATVNKSITIQRADAYVATATDGGSDSNNGSSTNPFLTLNKAIEVLKTGGRIHIANGEYSGALNRGLTINKNMTILGDNWITGTGTNVTINPENQNRTFTINSGITVTIQNLTLTNGYTTDVGGAICNLGNLTVNNCNFTQNQAFRGGAIYNQDNLTVNNCTFSNNRASVDGGAIWNYVYAGSVICIINQSTFTNNTANYGGAIMNYDIMGSLTCIINQSTFTGNHAYYNGGAIRNYNFPSGSLTYTITQSTFTDNRADINGGAIHNYNEGSMTCSINFSRFYNNTATSSGNALYNSGGSVNAENNWWGSNDPAFSTLITGEVDYSPWLYLTFSADPLSIPQGSGSTLTASFNQNSDGTNITQLDPANGHIPDGSPVIFTTTLGNVGSKSVLKYTFNGIATATLRADEAAGSALVGILADGQSLTSTVTITPVSAATTTSVNAATTTSNTVGMQSTGAPIVPLTLAVLSVLGGLAATRKKQ